jgi:hypothetical protein
MSPEPQRWQVTRRTSHHRRCDGVADPNQKARGVPRKVSSGRGRLRPLALPLPVANYYPSGPPRPAGSTRRSCSVAKSGAASNAGFRLPFSDEARCGGVAPLSARRHEERDHAPLGLIVAINAGSLRAKSSCCSSLLSCGRRPNLRKVASRSSSRGSKHLVIVRTSGL